MRLAVLSDTHGNLPALEAVLNDVQRYNVDAIAVAGDMTGGPHSVETIRVLRSLGSWMIRGNGDTALLQFDAGKGPAAWYSSHQYALMQWNHRQMNTDTLSFLRSLPEQRVIDLPGTATIRIVHGTPRDAKELMFPEQDPAALDRALAQIDEPVLVCGHTHQPWVQERNGRLALNPGAVCGPLNGEVGAQYALLTWRGDRWHVEHMTIPYDIGQIEKNFRESGLLEEGGALARSFLLSIKSGQDAAIQLLHHVYGLAAEAGFENCIVVPDPIWEQGIATFDWDRFAQDNP